MSYLMTPAQHFLRWVRAIFASALFALCAAQVGQAATPIPPDLKKAVTFVFLADASGGLLKDDDGNPVPYGTGFFVAIPVETDSSRAFLYLVTARHVLEDQQGSVLSQVYLRLDLVGGGVGFLHVLLPPNSIKTHSNSSVDLAVVPLVLDRTKYDFKAVSVDLIGSREKLLELHTTEGSDVFFTGLFVNYYGDKENIPVVRFGRFAMFPDQQILWREKGHPVQTADLYLLETQTFGGNSGSPVFLYLGADRTPGSLALGPPAFVLTGVMRGTFEQGRRIEISPTADLPVYRQNIGIAAVTPAFFLSEILFSDELQKVRASGIAR